MNAIETKVIGIVIAIGVAGLLIWKAYTEAYAAFGIWLFIVPLGIAGLIFAWWYKSQQRSEHPWEN